MGKARGAPPHGAAPRPPSVAPRARIPPPRKTDILYNLGQRLSARPKIHSPSGTKYTFCAEVRQAGHSGTPTGGRGAPFLLSQQPPFLPHPRKRSHSLVCFRSGPGPGPGRSLRSPARSALWLAPVALPLHVPMAAALTGPSRPPRSANIYYPFFKFRLTTASFYATICLPRR